MARLRKIVNEEGFLLVVVTKTTLTIELGNWIGPTMQGGEIFHRI